MTSIKIKGIVLTLSYDEGRFRGEDDNLVKSVNRVLEDLKVWEMFSSPSIPDRSLSVAEFICEMFEGEVVSHEAPPFDPKKVY